MTTTSISRYWNQRRDIAAAGKAAVDDQLEGIGHAGGGGGGDQQGDRGDGDMAGIAAREAPHHAEVGEALLLLVVGGGGHARPA